MIELTSQQTNLPIFREMQYTVTTSATPGTAVALEPAAVSVSSIARSGQVATVTTASDHNLVPGMVVTIAGADQGAYNGDQVIATVPSATTFTFKIPGTEAPTTPATGTITYTYQVLAQYVVIRNDDTANVTIGPNPDADFATVRDTGGEYALPTLDGGRRNMAKWYVKSLSASMDVKVFWR